MPFIDNYDIEDVDEILRLYSVNSSSTTTPELCVTSLVSDMRATCPLDEMARVVANVSRSPIYRYQVCNKSQKLFGKRPHYLLVTPCSSECICLLHALGRHTHPR